jgi:poly(U)-specific endoribonuclease
MDAKVENFYREIFVDPGVDREEAVELTEFLNKLNPPPDKLVWLRATAFKVGCEYLSDDKEYNVNLLRTINFVVHAIEKICMQ